MAQSLKELTHSDHHFPLAGSADRETKPVCTQFFEFFIVGVINTIVDLAVLNILIFTTGLGKEGGFSYSLFKGISAVAAILNSYYLNRAWVFKGEGQGKEAVQFSAFLAVSVFSALVNILVATLIVSHFHGVLISDNLWPTVGALCGTGASLLSNFAGYKYLVFRGTDPGNRDDHAEL